MFSFVLCQLEVEYDSLRPRVKQKKRGELRLRVPLQDERSQWPVIPDLRGQALRGRCRPRPRPRAPQALPRLRPLCLPAGPIPARSRTRPVRFCGWLKRKEQRCVLLPAMRSARRLSLGNPRASLLAVNATARLAVNAALMNHIIVALARARRKGADAPFRHSQPLSAVRKANVSSERSAWQSTGFKREN